MPNWKAPGPDCVQGSWLKNFKSIQEGLRRTCKNGWKMETYQSGWQGGEQF